MEAVKASSSSVQDDLLANIVVAGGSSSFPGFAARLQKEVAALTNMNVSSLFGLYRLPGKIITLNY